MFESDFTKLEGESQQHPAYASFVKAMSGKLYGHEALHDAWLWFKSGWDARHNAILMVVGDKDKR